MTSCLNPPDNQTKNLGMIKGVQTVVKQPWNVLQQIWSLTVRAKLAKVPIMNLL